MTSNSDFSPSKRYEKINPFVSFRFFLGYAVVVEAGSLGERTCIFFVNMETNVQIDGGITTIMNADAWPKGSWSLEPEKHSFISHSGHLEGEQRHLGDLLSIVANYLRVLWMILQKNPVFFFE